MERVSLVGGGAILFNPQGPTLGIGSFARVFVGKNQASGELVGSLRLSAALSLALSLTNPPPTTTGGSQGRRGAARHTGRAAGSDRDLFPR